MKLAQHFLNLFVDFIPVNLELLGTSAPATPEVTCRPVCLTASHATPAATTRTAKGSLEFLP